MLTLSGALLSHLLQQTCFVKRTATLDARTADAPVLQEQPSP